MLSVSSLKQSNFQLSRRWVVRSPLLIGAGYEVQRLSRAVAPAFAAPAFEVAVKGNPKNDILGDCPFCQRALLTFEEKHVPYSKQYIDFDDKPAWLLEVNPNGSVPVAKDLEADKWVVDSGVIADYLEDKYPEPHLGKSDQIPETGTKLFPAFVQFLKAPKEEEEAKKEAYLAQLAALSEYLKANGPYMEGANISAADLALAPKLYHAVEALKHFKGFEVPEQYGNVLAYLETIQQRPSWKATYYSPDLIVAGWQRHLSS